MKELTVKQRLEAYKWMRHMWLDSGLCARCYFWGIHEFGRRENGLTLINSFPELVAQRPPDKSYAEYWFGDPNTSEGFLRRDEVLKKAIAQLSPTAGLKQFFIRLINKILEI